jgi:hypothetical protein
MVLLIKITEPGVQEEEVWREVVRISFAHFSSCPLNPHNHNIA